MKPQFPTNFCSGGEAKRIWEIFGMPRAVISSDAALLSQQMELTEALLSPNW